MNYNQLFYFYVVATEGSVKAACKKLHLTQPTISGQLKTLEDDLGVRLFDRKNRKLILNDAGKEILKRAEKIFRLGEELLINLPSKKSRYRNRVRIGALPSLPNSFLHEFTLSIWSDSTISAHLIHGGLSELIRGLDSGNIDMVLSDSPYHGSKKYHSINLGRQKLIVVGAKKFLSLRKRFPHSLEDVPYLSFLPTGQLQSEINFFLESNQIRPDFLGAVDDANFIRLATEKGHSIGILPEMTVRESIRQKKLFKIGELSQITANAWAITSSIGSKRITLRKLVNNYLVRQRSRKQPLP